MFLVNKGERWQVEVRSRACGIINSSVWLCTLVCLRLGFAQLGGFGVPHSLGLVLSCVGGELAALGVHLRCSSHFLM